PRGKQNQGELDISRTHENDPLEPTSKITQQFGGLENGSPHIQSVSSYSLSARAASDSHMLTQHNLVNSHPRSFSSQSSLTPSQNGLAASPFQSKASFNKMNNFSSPSSQQPFNTASPKLQNSIGSNQLSSDGLKLGEDSQNHQYVPNRTPDRPAETASGDANSFSPSQLKPTGSKPSPKIDARQASFASTPQDHFAHRPSDRKGSIAANQVQQNSSRETAAADHRARQWSTDPSPRRQETSASMNSNPNLYEQLKLAQVVADTADQDELAVLKKMQDEWNREEDRREAREHSIAQNLQNSVPSSGVASNPVQFAASPISGHPLTNIIVNPVRSTPTKNRRTATRSESSDKIGQLNRQAHLAVSQTPMINQSSPSATSNQNPHTNNSATKKPECTVCGDTLTSPSETATLPCNHTYHPSCLASGFQHALAGGKLFTCCRSVPAPIDTVSSLLPPQFVANYKAKVIERSTPNPIYCARPGCASFIPPDHITGPLAECLKCRCVETRNIRESVLQTKKEAC
ncbi:MAG: hypothetical protein Q9214_004959, partial [Letrouitia sp. 1 TL-2023]